MKKFTFLFLILILIVQDSKSLNNSEETPKNKDWTFLGVNFISMNPNRYMFADNFFTDNINPGIGISANFMHVPKHFGFFGEVYYQENNAKLNNLTYQEYQNSYKFFSSGFILGAVGLHDVFKNGDLMLSAKAGAGFGNIQYPTIANGSSVLFQGNTSRSIMKQLGIQIYYRLHNTTYLKFGYDLRWTTLNFEKSIYQEKAYTDERIAMNVFNLGFCHSF